VKRLRPGRIRRRLPLKAARNGRLCVRVAIIGTSSGPGWAAICRERKPTLPGTSNNFLEVADNFLDSLCLTRPEMPHLAIGITGQQGFDQGLDYIVRSFPLPSAGRIGSSSHT